MRDAIKIMLIPIVGSIAIGIIFILIVWAANIQSQIVNPEAAYVGMATKDLGEYPIITRTTNCDNTYAPVCGHDGVTYENACKAAAAQLTEKYPVAYRGGCRA
jgi:hypothetical protein